MHTKIDMTHGKNLTSTILMFDSDFVNFSPVPHYNIYHALVLCTLIITHIYTYTQVFQKHDHCLVTVRQYFDAKSTAEITHQANCSCTHLQVQEIMCTISTRMYLTG